jgi:hypothetical protein
MSAAEIAELLQLFTAAGVVESPEINGKANGASPRLPGPSDK